MKLGMKRIFIKRDYMRKKAEHQNTGYELQKWQHPGGKLRELGAKSLSDAELLSILISTGIKGKSAEKIAEEILAKFGSFKGMSNQPLEKFLKIKGLGDVKIIRIAAAFEIAKRCVDLIVKDLKEDKELRKEVLGGKEDE
jgi:DNA repair protein RadC